VIGHDKPRIFLITAVNKEESKQLVKGRPKTKLGYLPASSSKPMKREQLTVGITFDTKDDFKFSRTDPWDWDAEFQVSVAVDDIVCAIEDPGYQTLLLGSGRLKEAKFQSPSPIPILR
jgi:hypothetical protein